MYVRAYGSCACPREAVLCLFMHVYVRAGVGAHSCAFAGVWQHTCVFRCVRAYEFICMYDYNIILLYMQAQCLRKCMRMLACVRTSVCTRVCACEGAHVRVCVCISDCMCVRVRLRQWGCVCECMCMRVWTLMHVRLRVRARVRAGVRSRAYICMCYYCILSLYVRAQFVSTRVRTCVIGVCTYVDANVCGRMCVRKCVRARVCMYVCRPT